MAKKAKYGKSKAKCPKGYKNDGHGHCVKLSSPSKKQTTIQKRFTNPSKKQARCPNGYHNDGFGHCVKNK